MLSLALITLSLLLRRLIFLINNRNPEIRDLNLLLINLMSLSVKDQDICILLSISTKLTLQSTWEDSLHSAVVKVVPILEKFSVVILNGVVTIIVYNLCVFLFLLLVLLVLLLFIIFILTILLMFLRVNALLTKFLSLLLLLEVLFLLLF